MGVGTRRRSVSLSILPFRNASGETSLDYLGAYRRGHAPLNSRSVCGVETVPGVAFRRSSRDLEIAQDSNTGPAN